MIILDRGVESIMRIEREVDESTLTSELAFISTVSKILRSYVNARNKKIIASPDMETLGFDFYLPQGLDTKTPVFIEVKYVVKESQIAKLLYRINQIHKYARVSLVRLILIVGVLDAELKDYFKSRLSVNESVQIDVWDISEFQNLANFQLSEFRDIEINPSMVLVNNALAELGSRPNAAQIQDSFISQLKREYEKEKIVLVLGAGVSISAGLPSWNRMISVLQAEMITHIVYERQGIPDAKAEQILELTNKYFKESNNSVSPIAQMRLLKSTLAVNDYNQMVFKALYGNTTKESKLLQAICKICKPNRKSAGVYSIITYNFDDLLERALSETSIEYQVVCKDDDVLSNDDLNVFHVHGYLPNNQNALKQELNLIFSEEEYHQVYNNPYSWSNLVQINSFRDKTCVFIGSSLTDPNLRRLLDISSRKGENPHHFAFLQRPSIVKSTQQISDSIIKIHREILESLNSTYYRTLGLNIIWVDDFNEIPDLLLKLK